MAKKLAVMPDGSKILVRTAYTAAAFTVPAAELDRLASIRPGYGSLDVLDERDGELSMYQRVRDFDRDGKSWTLLLNPAEYVVEVELTRGTMGELRALPPLEAYALVRELDRSETRYPVDRSVDRAQLVGVAQGEPAQHAVVVDGVLAHPPQRR
jgi:hypothetical protein